MRFTEQLRPYKMRILLTAAGLVLGILLLTIGFWQTLFLALFAFGGFLLGSYRDGSFGRIAARFNSTMDRL